MNMQILLTLQKLVTETDHFRDINSSVIGFMKYSIENEDLFEIYNYKDSTSL